MNELHTPIDISGPMIRRTLELDESTGAWDGKGTYWSAEVEWSGEPRTEPIIRELSADQQVLGLPKGWMSQEDARLLVDMLQTFLALGPDDHGVEA